jgi:hypothetical protein
MPRVFLSYRRDDTAAVTGRIDDQLRSCFGRESVFRDVETISSGTDFRREIKQSVTECDVLIAVIGERWLEADDTRRRPDDPDDFVRMEIAAALALDKPVLPVLVGRTLMPKQEELPHDLANLVYQNAIRLDHDWNFHHQVSKLIRDIEDLAQRKPSAQIINTVLRIVGITNVENEPLPIWNFTLINRSSSSQILNRVDCNVLEYHPYASIPQSRVLNSIVVWDIGLPYGEGSFSHTPTEPVLIAADDGTIISLRFHCIYQGKWISPKETAGYAMRIRFVSDQGLVAVSEQIYV